MKIIITEQQTKNLTESLINEQGLVDFINALKNDNQTTSGDNLGGDDFTTKFDITGTAGFDEMVRLVIEKLEGGYYHPNMLNDGRVKDRRYRKSGETMFGIDRRNGGDINTSSAGQQFWSTIDSANARSTWKWNYDGGSLKPKLLNLVSQMIKPKYDEYTRRFLSPEAAVIVNKDKRLMFNFIYATWNGEGWFKKFANKVNQSVLSGTKSPDEVNRVAINARTQSGNSLIAQGGRKIDSIVSTMA